MIVSQNKQKVQGITQKKSRLFIKINGLFLSQHFFKLVNRTQKRDISIENEEKSTFIGEKQSMRIKRTQILTAYDLRILLALCTASTLQKTTSIKTSLAEIRNYANLSKSGKQTELITQSLKKLEKTLLTYLRKQSEPEKNRHVLDSVVIRDEPLALLKSKKSTVKSTELHIEVSSILMLPLSDKGSFTLIDINELKALKSDASFLLHANLSSLVKRSASGKTHRTVNIEKLIENLYFDESRSYRDKKRRVIGALFELEKTGFWDVRQRDNSDYFEITNR